MKSHSAKRARRPATKKKRLLFFAIAGFFLILVAARIALPWVIKSYVNKTLDGIPGYYGHVDDIHVALWRGAYQVLGLKVLKKHGRAEEPFFSTEKIDISIDWRALFYRRLLAGIVLQRPSLKFVKRPTEASSQTSIDKSWQQKVYKLIPFQINRLTIYNGFVGYKDQTSEPKIDLYFQNLNLQAENISNATRDRTRLPSSMQLQALFLGSGLSTVNAKVDFLSVPMEAELKASIRNLDLKEINAFARAYGNFDFKAGKFQLAMELAASRLRYEGYVKTLFQKVDILNWKKERRAGRSVKHLVWESLVGAIVDIFKNHHHDQFGARIPISGSREKMRIDKWSTLGSVLRNAFVKALSPQLEDSVKFSDVTRPPGTAR